MAFKGTERFRIVQRLGAGSFGSVYEAEDTNLQRNVALKLLERVDPESLVRFKQEFRSLADFRHRNVVAMYELLSAGDKWFYTMELVRGSELLEYLARQEILRAFEHNIVPLEGSTALTEAYVRDIRVALIQLADAINAIHSFGKLHRDIKPTNILVTDDGRVVLLDFGLVRETQKKKFDGDDTTSLVGTPGYMSPEQVSGAALTEASDWYAFGVVLYQALTGTLPFTGAFFEIAVAQQTKDARPPEELVSGLPDDLNQLCIGLLKRDPAERPGPADIRNLLASSELTYWLPPFRSRRLGYDRSFVGRRQYLDLFSMMLREAKHGEARAIFLHGTSGVGKTALVNAFLDQTRAANETFILATRCYERELMPYRAFDGVVDSFARLCGRFDLPADDVTAGELAVACSVFPILKQVDRFRGRIGPSDTLPSGDVHATLAQFFVKILRVLATSRPTVVFVDDAQWGDFNSGQLFNAMFRAGAPPVLFILSYTTEDFATSLLLQTFRQEQGESRYVIELQPLEEDEARRLVEGTFGRHRITEELTSSILREAAGNAFFVEELINFVKENNIRSGSITLSSVLDQRFSGLSERARALVALVAAAGSPVNADWARESLGLDRLAGDEFSILRQQRWIRSRFTGDLEEVEIYHSRLREYVQGLGRTVEP